jgi:hypothetical protein
VPIADRDEPVRKLLEIVLASFLKPYSYCLWTVDREEGANVDAGCRADSWDWARSRNHTSIRDFPVIAYVTVAATVAKRVVPRSAGAGPPIQLHAKTGHAYQQGAGLPLVL